MNTLLKAMLYEITVFFLSTGVVLIILFKNKILTIKKCLFRLILFHMSHDNKKKEK